MFRLYAFKDRNGKTRIMRAATIHKKVMEDSFKSRYNWIASVTNLISVCTEKDFPINYAINIKVVILNCFAGLIIRENPQRQKTDIESVYYAYNSLFGITDEKVINARKNFLNGFLANIYWQALQSNLNNKSFERFCRNWQEEMLKKLIVIESINFNNIKITLKEGFKNTLQSTNTSTLFAEESNTDSDFTRNLLDELEESIEKYGTPNKPKLKNLTITSY